MIRQQLLPSTDTIWLHELLLLQVSVAVQVRVTTSGLIVFVTVRTLIVTLPQPSVAVGGSNVQGTLQSTLLFVAQMRTGGVVSTTVTVWLQVTLLVHASVACQVRVILRGHSPFVTVLKTEIATLVQQFVRMVGVSKFHAVLQSTVLLVAH
jgi:hypothetical protein